MPSTAVATRPAAAPPAPAGAAKSGLPTVEAQVHRWGAVSLAAAIAAGAQAVYFAVLVGGWLAARAATDGWLPEKVHIDLYRGSMIVITAVLAAATAQWAVSAARRGDGAHTSIASAMSLGLGLAAADLAWFTMVKIDVGASSSVYASMWYALLGSYLVAALGGCIVQAVALVRSIGGHHTDTDHQPVTAAAVQWHLLAVVGATLWLAIWVMK